MKPDPLAELIHETVLANTDDLPDDLADGAAAAAEKVRAWIAVGHEEGLDWRSMFARYATRVASEHMVVEPGQGVAYLRPYDWTAQEWASIRALQVVAGG